MAIIGNRTILPLPVEEHPGGTVSISASSRRTLELLLPRGGVTIRDFEHSGLRFQSGRLSADQPRILKHSIFECRVIRISVIDLPTRQISDLHEPLRSHATFA